MHCHLYEMCCTSKVWFELYQLGDEHDNLELLPLRAEGKKLFYVYYSDVVNSEMYIYTKTDVKKLAELR